jgi:hypothetical protein
MEVFEMISTGELQMEQKIVEHQRKRLKLKELRKFDLDLGFGVKYEKSLANILKMGKIEVKTEKDKWFNTRNIAIELSYYGKKSGLTSTEAEWWAHILTLDDKIRGVILLPVERLKKIVKSSVKSGFGRIVMGGDDEASELALIPLKDLANEI